MPGPIAWPALLAPWLQPVPSSRPVPSWPLALVLWLPLAAQSWLRHRHRPQQQS
jgi:hypothetical protein